MITFASSYFRSQHLVVFYRQIVKGLLSAKEGCHLVAMNDHICILQHLEVGTDLKDSLNRGGSMYYFFGGWRGDSV